MPETQIFELDDESLGTNILAETTPCRYIRVPVVDRSGACFDFVVVPAGLGNILHLCEAARQSPRSDLVLLATITEAGSTEFELIGRDDATTD